MQQLRQAPHYPHADGRPANTVAGNTDRPLPAQGYALSEELRTARDVPARERLTVAAVPPLMRAAAALSRDAAVAGGGQQRSAAVLRSMLKTLLVRLHGSVGDLSAEVRFRLVLVRDRGRSHERGMTPVHNYVIS